ncbi:MAG: hypothetical protein ACOX0Y_03030 [Thiopseudomonas sp.]
MKQKIKDVLRLVYGLVLDKAQTIPKPVYSRMASSLQSIGGTLVSAGIVGFAVLGDAVEPAEAVQIFMIGVGIFVCGTIVDIKASK